MASSQTPRMLQSRLARASSRLMYSPASALSRIFGARCSSSVPSVTSASFWKSLVPKPLRRSDGPPDTPGPKAKGWNPATFYIVLFMFIGSMSIQMIRLKTNFEAFTRQSDLRIGLLREVVEKLQKGEEVDVERVLGSGDPDREKEWEEVLREIERDGNASSRRRNKRGEKQSSDKTPAEGPSKSNSSSGAGEPPSPTTSSTEKGDTSGFY